MQLIINADDLGISQEVNNATFDLISKGLISSSTIIANGLFIEDAVERAKELSQISFGIHLNITSLSPLTSNNDLKEILDASGNFLEKHKQSDIEITKSLSDAIFLEFCSQVKKLTSMGIKISHFDSHEHIHTVPAIFPIIKRLQKKYGIRKVRISRNIYLPDYKTSKILLLKKMIYNFILRNYYPTKTTSGFGCLLSFYKNAGINNLNYATVEIMVHPGSDKFQQETALLKPGWHNDFSINLSLINYNQL